MTQINAHIGLRGQIVMNSHKKVQPLHLVAASLNQSGARHESVVSERMALVELLQGYLTITVELHQYVNSLELRLRNVSFVDVRQLFHRIGAAVEHCSAFLDERILDLGAPSQRQTLRLLGDNPVDALHNLSFATCIQHIGTRTHALMGFSTQAKEFMDRAVINGDYNSLHLVTDCIYQISQLVALIQIHIPADPLPSPAPPQSLLHGAL